MGVNTSITSSTIISTVGDNPTDYFGLGKPAVACGVFPEFHRTQGGGYEAMGFGGLDRGEKKLQFELTESTDGVSRS